MPALDKPPQTLYDKVLKDHIVNEQKDGTILLYIGTYYFTRATPFNHWPLGLTGTDWSS